MLDDLRGRPPEFHATCHLRRVAAEIRVPNVYRAEVVLPADVSGPTRFAIGLAWRSSRMFLEQEKKRITEWIWDMRRWQVSKYPQDTEGMFKKLQSRHNKAHIRAQLSRRWTCPLPGCEARKFEEKYFARLHMFEHDRPWQEPVLEPFPLQHDTESQAVELELGNLRLSA